MRISELSSLSGVPVATIKYYLREGLLPSGRALSRTQAEYDEAHLERLRLIRALTGAGGLGLARVRRVLEVIDDPAVDRLSVLATAQRAVPPVVVAAEPEPGESRGASSRLRAWSAARGWSLDPDDPLLDQLDAAWSACDDAGIGLDEGRMDAYADAAERIAQIDVATVPASPTPAVRQVVLGTVLMDPVLALLRRLAQQHLSAERAAGRSGGPSPRP